MTDFDVIVVGGGSAGSSAARAASRAGARTAMINDGELGGLCILRGCMPTKAMLATAHAVHESTRLEPFGARLEGRVVVDFPQVMQRKDRQVERFKRAKIAGIESEDYDVIPARARFASDGDLTLDGRRLTAEAYVVATGSVPVSLPIDGIDQVPVWTSDDVMRLQSPPRSLLVQGAGPIGLELAQFFARIGTRVVLVNRSPLLSRFDADAGAELTSALETESNLEILAPGKIERLRKDGDGLVATLSAGGSTRSFPADALLMAAGRRAALDDLGLEHVGLRASHGRLEHDACMRTVNPRIFVAGDATGNYQILHLANQEGQVAGHNAAGAKPEATMDYRLAIHVVFTDPPYAQVGDTEDEALQDGRDVIVGRARFAETGRAITMETHHGIWKLFADRATGEILGSTILGPRADDLVHLVAVMMHYGARAPDIGRLPWYHPTLSEVMLDLNRDLARQMS